MSEGTTPNFKLPSPPLRRSSSDLWFLAYLPLSLSDGLSTPLIPLLAISIFALSHPSDAFTVTAIIAASTVFEVPCTMLWGNLSDRVRHRKWFLVASFVATGAILIAMALPGVSLFEYIGLNLAEGVTSAASAPVGTLLLLETRNKRWWARDLGRFGLISGVGTVAGLIVGSVWFFGADATTLATAMKWLLGLAGSLAVLAGVLATTWVDEPHALVSRDVESALDFLERGVVERLRRTRRRMIHILELTRGVPHRMPRAEYAFLAGLLVMSIGFQVFYGPFIYFLQSSPANGGPGLSQQAIFLVYLTSAAASTGLFYHSGLAVESGNPKWVFIVSLFARALLIPLFYLVPGIVGDHPLELVGILVLLNGLMGVSWAFVSTASTLFLIRLVHGPARGKALGLYNALAGLGGLAGTLWGGLLYSFFGGPKDVFLIASAIVLVGALMLVPIRYRPVPFEPVPVDALRKRAPRKVSG